LEDEMIKRKPTYEDLQKRVKALERNAHKAKKVEEVLKIQNAYLELFFDNAPDAFVLADKEHRVTRVSPQFTRMFGFTPEEALGQTIDDLIAGKDKLEEATHVTNQVGRGQKIRMEGIRYTKNGSPVYVDLVAAPVWAGNEQIGTYASYRDITERKKSEVALRESEERYRSLIENIPVGVYRCTPGPHGRFLMANPAFLHMFGFASEEELKKTRVSDIYMDPGQRKGFSDSLLEKKSLVTSDRHLKRTDGTPLWAVVSAKVAYDAVLGEPAYFDCVIVDTTERKQAEEKLRDSERRYRELIEGSLDGYALVNLNGRIVESNSAFRQLLGLTEEELSERTYEDLTPEKWHASETDIIRKQVLRRGYSDVYEKEYVKKDGTIFPVELRTYLRKDERGIPTGMWAFVRDVTDRKMAEEALKESHSTLLTVLDGIDATIYVADMETYKILFANKYMKSVFGRDLVGGTCWELFRGQSQPCSHCTNAQLLDSDGRPIGGCVWEGKNPISDRWYINFDRAIKWVDGRMVRLQVAMDITDRKENELALKREKGYLDALHETALGLMSRLEAEELLEAIVEKAARLVGTPHGYVYLYDQDRGDLILKIGVGAYGEMVGLRMRPGEGLSGKVLRSGEPLIVEDYRSWPERSPDSRFDDLSAVIGLPLKSEGQVSGVIGVGYFGESRKFTPAEIIALSRFAAIASIAMDNALLYSRLKEELVEREKAEAERSKLESQLQHAQRMEAIGTLAGGIAHDFNNILMGIQGRTSLMLLDVPSSAPHFEHLKGIEKYVQDAASLTRQLLGFARGGKYEEKATDLNDLIHRSAQMFGRTKKEIRIHGKYQEALWTAMVDRNQIEQVLLNLYVNAWQAMPEGGDLYIETENVFLNEKEGHPYGMSSGRYVRVSVTDTGLGMDEQTRQRIFEPFFTTKKKGRGTGLGLASAYGIIKNHGGMIEVESEKGVGTCFRIYLPASDKQVTKDSEAPEEFRRGAEGVLLVDDEEMIRSVVSGMLESMGYRVWQAENGEIAIDLLAKHKGEIHLVILDMIMPGMGGGEVFDRLKRCDPAVKVLLSSGYSLEGEANRIMDRGCDGFIQKPFTTKAVSAKLREMLGDEK
jgi:PAS domain S-box-containing protein